MFGIGGAELFLILIFLFLIVGPERLPQMGRTIGRAIRQFKNAQDEVNKVIQKEVVDPFKQVDQDMRRDPFAGAFGEKKVDDYSAGRAGSTDYAAMQAQNASAQEEEETFAERKARMAKQKEEARARKQAKKEAAMAKKKAEKEKAKAAAGEAGEAGDAVAEAVETAAAAAPAAAATAAARAAATQTTPARPGNTGVKKVEPETPVISQKSVPSVAASLYGLPSTPVKRATFGKPAAGKPASTPASEPAPADSGKGGEADA